ncbi:hypothetical protein LU699_15480 [Luteimonas fraxinea]|uniref:hypothetical protein n=1 Tax=Luteimonas fraxinea TaxID=2901869 RepID=UPI001E53ED16|nr:hypothetical protein [Luteimonas fraxinea]UHH09644.1 hypothetical protein LU699_15480 [Luteimonas fraxinea]
MGVVVLKPQFRNRAHKALARARDQMASGNLRYAALELRMAIEALTYDRALAYERELPAEARTKWQPRQVMDALLEIDPHAGTSYRVSIGKEPALGVAPENMTDLGEDVVFGLSEIKRHYHALGSYLHMPSMQQASEAAVVDETRMRERIEATAEAVSKSLASKIWNFTISPTYTFNCLRCGHPVHKRVADQVDQIVAHCPECKAPHVNTLQEDGEVIWRARWEEFPCPTENCGGKHCKFPDELVPGLSWTCSDCDRSYYLVLGTLPYTAPPTAESAT